MKRRWFHQLLPLAVLFALVIVASEARTAWGKFFRPSSPHGAFVTFQSPSGQSGNAAEPAEVSDHLGSVTGRVVDDRDQPVYAIKVILTPLDVPVEADASPPESRDDWTNKDGVYEFTSLATGEYILGVAIDTAPTGKHPFFASFYPGAERKKDAEPIRVHPGTNGLRTMRLRRMETATIKIHVRWEDGTPAKGSSLLFNNPKFPQAVIGDESFPIANGEGEFVVPLGFRYYARASVWCDGGEQIDMRESRPVQEVRVDAKHIPRELIFVMRSKPCKLWTPR